MRGSQNTFFCQEKPTLPNAVDPNEGFSKYVFFCLEKPTRPKAVDTKLSTAWWLDRPILSNSWCMNPCESISPLSRQTRRLLCRKPSLALGFYMAMGWCKIGWYTIADPVNPAAALRVIVASKRTGPNNLYRIHRRHRHGSGVRLAPGLKIQDLSMSDYVAEPETYGKCERCFKGHGFPEG